MNNKSGYESRTYRCIVKVEPTVATACCEPSPVWTERDRIDRLLVMCKHLQARARVSIPETRRGVE